MSESIIFGFHAVLSRLRQHPESVQEICVDRSRADARMQDLLSVAEQKNTRVMSMDKARLDG
jgi:23S rRNA (guanosine2251-2'-O)-methyltransferase